MEKLIQIMNELREKCPWDKEQTILSLRNNTIEECFELTQALIEENPENIKEELGDLLLHIVFYSKIAQENNWFKFNDVVEKLCQKLIYRHPHIYGEVVAENQEDVKKNWEKLKLNEKKDGGLLSGVPKTMPALPKALRISQKAAAVGFDWKNKKEVWKKVKEEINEVEQEIKKGTQQKIEEEFGDLFFALTNAARKYKVDPEAALEKTNRKFIKRFEYIEKSANEKKQTLQNLTLEEMEKYWMEAKTKTTL